MLTSDAEIALQDPAGLAEALRARLAEHDVAFETRGGRTVVDLGVGAGTFEATARTLKVSVEAADLGSLETLRSIVASNLIDFADGSRPEIVWRGNVAAAATFANFREMRLRSAVTIGPRMRRLAFVGEDVALFDSASDLHVRLYFPPEGVERPQWPRPGLDGRTIWPAEALRPQVRYYTVRRVDAAAGLVEVDFVIHDDAGPGSGFAERAAPGALCGMAGPLGRGPAPAGWTLLAGDETALPAIARILEAMPADARGAALIEVSGAEDEVPLAAPEGMEVRWLRRDGAPAGTTTLLADAVRAAAPAQGCDVAIWCGCESAAARAIRRFMREERAIPRDRCLVVGYWERAA